MPGHDVKQQNCLAAIVTFESNVVLLLPTPRKIVPFSATLRSTSFRAGLFVDSLTESVEMSDILRVRHSCPDN